MGKEYTVCALFLVTWTKHPSGDVKAYGFKEVEDVEEELIWIPAQYVGEMTENYKRNTFVEAEIEEWIAKEKGLI